MKDIFSIKILTWKMA